MSVTRSPNTATYHARQSVDVVVSGFGSPRENLGLYLIGDIEDYPDILAEQSTVES
jgi:hypothetical protein